MNNRELLKLTHISKKFNGYTALEDISISLHQGEILGFLGPSGAGKTTTIKIVTGQLRQTSGEALILGRDSREIDESIYEKIGIVTDNSGIYDRLSVYQNLRLFSKILRVPKSRIDDLLENVGLADHRKKPAGKLSKGQAQRLVLARAVLHTPRLLFLDEPTAGLDPSTALVIHKLLKELNDDGMAIFLTTHNMEEAAKLCNRVALLNEGHIVECGTPQELCLRYYEEKRYKVLLSDKQELLLEQNAQTAEQLKEWISQDKVESLHSCEPNLEKVFLKVTGRSLQ